MPKKFIFIPVVNHFHLLQKAINSVPDGLFDEYFIFNNSGQNLYEHLDLKHFKIFEHHGELTFKDTQNKMREYAIKNINAKIVKEVFQTLFFIFV